MPEADDRTHRKDVPERSGQIHDHGAEAPCGCPIVVSLRRRPLGVGIGSSHEHRPVQPLAAAGSAFARQEPGSSPQPNSAVSR